jgi:hypothetical protein
VLGQGRAAASGQGRAAVLAGEVGRAAAGGHGRRRRWDWGVRRCLQVKQDRRRIHGRGGGGCLGRGLLRPRRRQGRRRQPVPPPPEP